MVPFTKIENICHKFQIQTHFSLVQVNTWNKRFSLPSSPLFTNCPNWSSTSLSSPILLPLPPPPAFLVTKEVFPRHRLISPFHFQTAIHAAPKTLIPCKYFLFNSLFLSGHLPGKMYKRNSSTLLYSIFFFLASGFVIQFF